MGTTSFPRSRRRVETSDRDAVGTSDGNVVGTSEGNVELGSVRIQLSMGYCEACHSELSADLEFCPVCGTRVPASQRQASGVAALFAASDDWDPRAPVLSVATSVLLLWAALHRLEAGPFGVLVFALPGLAILPRVRLAIGRWGGRKPAEPGVLALVVVISTVLLYAFLAGSAALTLYLAAGSEHSYAVPVSRFAPVQAYVLSVFGVGAVRGARRLQAT